jgi:hypothetical protein
LTIGYGTNKDKTRNLFIRPGTRHEDKIALLGDRWPIDLATSRACMMALLNIFAHRHAIRFSPGEQHNVAVMVIRVMIILSIMFAGVYPVSQTIIITDLYIPFTHTFPTMYRVTSFYKKIIVMVKPAA